ncbi:tRNA(His) guanylyltransferase Thg1 family protein [Dictyobacter kobayashii]|uniref:tRNA(His) guanylyltransferase n=1 Tax=Dictyobacter kobayashii TaxID=2014872 RepID=A0A402ATZ4_9CHLR|nr:tRNA(His) guanylyltransferase Thg1 family protein [Dictyobacter kobayashii]GCE22590.1 guanylyltransferase [Dictyobacter kobayashii]
MDSDYFEKRMRELEYFHSLRCLPGTWIVLRLDGRGFTKFTARAKFERPFDGRFQEYMRTAAQSLLEELQGLYVFTESDEISIVFPPQWDLFDREVEKLISISASIASVAFALASQLAVQFDSRIWLSASQEQVIDYFRWRQTDTTRCALNGWCHWTLLKEGLQPNQATAQLTGKTLTYKQALLQERGIEFDTLPYWQRYGTGFYWETYEKTGYNPHLQRHETTQRRRMRMQDELPIGEAYGEFIAALLAKSLV